VVGLVEEIGDIVVGTWGGKSKTESDLPEPMADPSDLQHVG